MPGSLHAYSFNTSCSIGRNLGFSLKVEGVGGRVVVVPMERERVGGSVGRRVRMCVVEGACLSGKTYCDAIVLNQSWHGDIARE